jgi:His-Xaa-Ser system radical SAM maturase HxsB
MTGTRQLTIERPELNTAELGYFRYGYIGDKVVLTNDAGEWHALTKSEFHTFLAGKVQVGHPHYTGLQKKGFIRADLDVEHLAEKVRRKKSFMGIGPHLHVMITTLRCNQSCKYCHASRTDMDRVDTDMSLDVAKKAVDLAMQTTSPYVNFEYQGGEPTVNFPVLQFCVEYSREKNKYENKLLDHSVVTNMTYMNEERADWLLDNNVLVCTSLDGPERIHNWNRSWKGGGNAYERVVHWMKYFNDGFVKKGMDPQLWHIDALMTTTKKTMKDYKEVVDLYVDLGIRNIHLRPLNPFGFAQATWKAIGYSWEEYVEFYTNALDYILQLNRQGVQIIEGTASTFLHKMLTPEDPNFVDIRSPVGSGTGQVAYGYDGSVYPSDEGRMVAAMGNDIFRLGHVDELTYKDIVQHPTVKTMAVASLLDSLPGCSTCWNAPYCGVRPMHNYMNFGDLLGQRPRTPKCTEHMGISRILFEKMINDPTGEIETIFRRWTIRRPREA